MPASGRSRADENRAIRQEALREQLAAKGLVQQVLEISEKIADLSGEKKADNADLDSLQVTRLKSSADLKLKLISKYLPDLKQSEIEMNVSGEVKEIAINDVG